MSKEKGDEKRRLEKLRPSPVAPAAPDGNLDILAYEDSPLGVLCLRRRRLLSAPGTVVTEITLRHELLMSSLNTLSERELVTRALERHTGRDLRVLVGGLGLGVTALEVLRSDRVAHVVVIELLEQVISWMSGDLLPLSRELKEDPRLEIVQGDVYERLQAPPAGGERFDVLLIDVDHSPRERLDSGPAPFYTRSALLALERHLAARAVLGVWSYESSESFLEELRSVFEIVEAVEVPYRNPLTGDDHADWIFLARDPVRAHDSEAGAAERSDGGASLSGGSSCPGAA